MKIVIIALHPLEDGSGMPTKLNLVQDSMKPVIRRIFLTVSETGDGGTSVKSAVLQPDLRNGLEFTIYLQTPTKRN